MFQVLWQNFDHFLLENSLVLLGVPPLTIFDQLGTKASKDYRDGKLTTLLKLLHVHNLKDMILKCHKWTPVELAMDHNNQQHIVLISDFNNQTLLTIASVKPKLGAIEEPSQGTRNGSKGKTRALTDVAANLTPSTSAPPLQPHKKPRTTPASQSVNDSNKPMSYLPLHLQ